MQTKDYYKILEVSDFASDSEIKSAYRKLARKFHPDVAGSDETSVARFKDINEAYCTLINKQKRHSYDALRRLYSYSANVKQDVNNESPINNKCKEQKSTISNFWHDFIKSQKAKEYAKQPLPKDGSDITTDVVITLQESINGTVKKVNVLHTKPCSHCSGRKFSNGTVCGFCNGKGYTEEHKKLAVKIPAGVKNGYKIRIAGEGNQGANGGKNGNIYLIIKIENNSNFKYDGINVIKTVPITPAEAVLGAEIEVSTLRGMVTMKILPNTNSGQKFRLQGLGIVKDGLVGDLIVTVEIKIPNKLSNEEIDLYKKLSKFNSSSVRKGL